MLSILPRNDTAYRNAFTLSFGLSDRMCVFLLEHVTSDIDLLKIGVHLVVETPTHHACVATMKIRLNP